MKYVLYRRLSVDKRKDKKTLALGMKAQTRAIRAYINQHPGEIVGRYSEIESGANNSRPRLARAVRRARVTGATLLVSKLDRLARDALFLGTLQRSGVKMAFCNLPGAADITVGMLALLAQHELQLIRTRTKEALAVLKSEGVPLGTKRAGFTLPDIKAKLAAKGITWEQHLAKMRKAGTAVIRAKWEQKRNDAYADYLPKIIKRRERGDTLQSICDWLNSTRCPTASGVITGRRFDPTTIRRLLESPTETSVSNS